MIDTENKKGTKTEVLPEFWPQSAPSGVARAWWIPWPVAILLVPLLWVMPKRMGPHFAAVRWPGVILGHLLWTVYGIGCIGLAYRAPHYGWIAWLTGQSPGQADPGLWPPPSAWDIFRAPLALEAVWLGQTITSIEEYLLGWGAVLGCELGVAAIGLLLMPYVTVGERTGRLVARCIKLTMWATTSVVLLGLALQAAALFYSKSRDLLVIVIIACCGYVVWLLWMWGRSAARYWGPAEGPGWERRRPMCEACGYTLTGLTAADRCPECGRAVAESLPERREPMPYSAARGLGRIPALFQMTVRVLVGRSPLDRLAVHDAYAGARSFAVLTCVLTAGVVAPLLGPRVAWSWFGTDYINGRLDPLTTCLAAWTAFFVAALAANSLIALGTRAVTRLPLQPRAAIVFLHSPWYVLLGLVIALGLMACLMTTEPRLTERETLTWIGVFIGAVALFAVMLTKTSHSLFRSLQRTRFANA